MDPELPMDFSSLGKEDDEARLEALSAADGGAAPLTPSVVSTPQPEMPPTPATPVAPAAAVEPAVTGPGAGPSQPDLPAPPQPHTDPPAAPAGVSVAALVDSDTAAHGDAASKSGGPAASTEANPSLDTSPSEKVTKPVAKATETAAATDARPEDVASSGDGVGDSAQPAKADPPDAASSVTKQAADSPPEPAAKATVESAEKRAGKTAEKGAAVAAEKSTAEAAEKTGNAAKKSGAERADGVRAESDGASASGATPEPPATDPLAVPDGEEGSSAGRQEAGRLAQIIAEMADPEPAAGRRVKLERRSTADSEEEEPAAAALAPDVHCLVCNEPVMPEEAVQLTDFLENAHVRVEEKLGNVITNDYRLYLHSETVCERCHHTLCQIQDLEMQTKHLKDQVVGFFWDTVEVRGVRPQRKGRRKSKPSKLLLEAQATALLMPEMELDEPEDPVICKAPQKKISRYSKPKCYEKLSNNEYQCIRCHKVLPRMRAVTKHFDLVHGKKEEQCDVCEKYFRDRPHLIRHRHKMHPELAEQEPPAAAAGSGEPGGDAAGASSGSSAAGVKLEKGEPSAAGDGDEDGDGAADDDYELPAPLIDDDDAEDEDVPDIDMDVVMNIEVERPRRGRKRRHSSQSSSMGAELGVMYAEDGDGGSSPRFRCLLCPNTYSRPAKARDHYIAKHAQIKRFACTLCSEMFLTYKQKRHHELSHTAEMCTKCGKKYPGNKRGLLERHIAQCGEQKKCRVCEAVFDNDADFIKHRRDAHEKNATCDVCGKTVSARNLASHRAIHSDERNYTCHLCGSSFKAKGSLDTHLRTHSEDRPFTCETCGRSFKHRNNWKDHERGHLNIRDFVCHFCSKSFKQAKNLKQHLRQHDANPEIFTCPHCPSTFKYKYNMLAHVKTLHTGEASRRVRRRMRAPSELSGGGPSGAGPHGLTMDPLQLSPGSVTSDSNSGAHPAAAAPAGRSLPQLNPLNPSVVFMQTLQHHSIFSS